MKPELARELWNSLLLLLASATWGMGFVAAKWAFVTLTPLYFIFFRFLIASIFMVLLCGPKRLKTLSKKDILPACLLGTAFGAALLIQAVGLNLTSASNAALLTGTYIVIVPFIGIFWKRKLHWADVVIALVALVGLALFSLQDDFTVGIGDLVVLLCALSFAVHCLLVDRYAHQYDGLVLNFGQLVVATVWAGLCALLFEPAPDLRNLDGGAIFGLLYCAIVASALGRYLQVYTQKSLSPATAAIIMTSQSVFGAVFGFLFLHEVLFFRQYISAAILVLCMVVAVLWPHLRQKKETTLPPEQPDAPEQIEQITQMEEIG